MKQRKVAGKEQAKVEEEQDKATSTRTKPR